MISGISSKTGKVYHGYYGKYLNGPDIVEFLDKIRLGEGKRKFAIHWDNCPVHKSGVVKEYAIEHNLQLVKNVPYGP